MSASSRVPSRSASSHRARSRPPVGQRLEVVGPVEPGRRVDRGPGRLHQRDVLAGAHMRRALEHHVLEQVGEAGPARLLVPRADVVPEVDRDRRRAMVGTGDHPQAVVERVLLDGVGEIGARGHDLIPAHRPSRRSPRAETGTVDGVLIAEEFLLLAIDNHTGRPILAARQSRRRSAVPCLRSWRWPNGSGSPPTAPAGEAGAGSP